jgi:general secretion pathway protein A
MFLDYYKLSEQPFGVTPDSRFLYLGPKHREALASLVYGTESNRGFLALIAKPGMGKTSLLYHYLEYLRGKARTAFVFRTDCDSREFIRHVMLDLGVDIKGMDLPEMHEALNRLLTEEMRAGRRFVLVIDEAQNLEEKVLESIRLLSNFETPWMKLMQIVLAGQPQLADRLASPALAQLRQRVSMVIRIEPFTQDEVNAYIDHRLYVAGCSNPKIFTPGARKEIAEHSEGIPRNINNLCFNAMSLACALQHKAIDREVIREVIRDLDLDPLREEAITVPKPAAARTAPPFISNKAPKETELRSWIPPKAALAGALIATSVWAVVQIKQTRTQVTESAVNAATKSQTAGLTKPAAVPPVSPSPVAADPVVVTPAAPAVVTSGPAPSALSSVVPAVEPPSQSVSVKPGQTVYQISLAKFGKYDDEVLGTIRELNPWMKDPARIQPGQRLRIPSAAGNQALGQPADERQSTVPSAEVGKQ